MNLMDDFYQKILNIENREIEEIVKSIVLFEKNKVLEKSDFLDGYCKYLCHQIKEELKKENIYAIDLDLSELISIDHMALLIQYKFNNEMKTILIDPTFIQFVESLDKELINLSHWPSEKVSEELLKYLLEYGYAFINNDLFNNYLNAFLDSDQEFNLEEYIFNKKSEKFQKTI